MLFSRRHAEGTADLELLRKKITIGIFGSFDEEYKPVLYGAKRVLTESGFVRVLLSSDLERDNPRGEEETDNDYNLRMSDLLIKTSRIHIFFFFRQNSAPVHINESTLMELAVLRKTQSLDTAYLLIHNEVEFAGIGRATTGKYMIEEFDDPSTTFPGIVQFCRNRIYEIIQRNAREKS